MGEISKKLAARFKKDRRAVASLRREFQQVEIPKDLRDARELCRSGYDPLHELCNVAQNAASVFAETVSRLPEFDDYCEAIGKAEEEYMPGGPPMSPLTISFFTQWAFYDFSFGKDFETVASVLIDVAEPLGFSPDFAKTICHFAESRMGIFEHVGRSARGVLLRELVTDCQIETIVPAGYGGKKGELWYVRTCPPLFDLADNHLAMTTPYILTGAGKADWTAYLRKSILGASPADTVSALGAYPKTAGDCPDFAQSAQQNGTVPLSEAVFGKALSRFFKTGPSTNHWNEFVFQAYHHHQFEAIFLAGLPDVASSRPHAPHARRN